MGRPKRIAFGGYVYQVLNRANGRLRIFKKGGDFEAFEQVLSEGIERFDMRICGWCLMGNQWHLMLWPRRDGDLSAFMRWTTLTHVQRFHASHGTVGIGHLYQGRYKSFPDQDNACYLTVMRYVEGNPVRAGIVKHAADWRWSSFSVRQGRDSKVGLAEGPLSLPGDWESLVHCEIDPKSAEEIGKSVKRGRPLGDADWRTGTAKELNLEATLRETKKSTGHLHLTLHGSTFPCAVNTGTGGVVENLRRGRVCSYRRNTAKLRLTVAAETP